MKPRRVSGLHTIEGFIVEGYRAPTFKGHFGLKEGLGFKGFRGLGFKV